MRGTMWSMGLVLVAACNMRSTPVPIRGNAELLVGEWSGDYTSPVTGRNGSIVFTLQAGRDTAFGDVLMIPANYQPPPDDRGPALTRPTAQPQVLRISFVGCQGKEVTGWLDPYADPETGEKVFTSFSGVLDGNLLKGTFVSHGDLSGKRFSGNWSVKRKRAKRA